MELLVRLHERDLLFYADFFAQLLDHLANLTDRSLGRGNRVGNNAFRQLLGADLNHIHRFFAAAKKQIQVPFCKLLVRRIDHELAVHSAQSAGPYGAQERNLADRQGSAGADHRQNIRIIPTVRTQDVRDDLHFLKITFGEQGPNRPVDLPRR